MITIFLPGKNLYLSWARHMIVYKEVKWVNKTIKAYYITKEIIFPKHMSQ